MISNNKDCIIFLFRHCPNLSTEGWLTNYCVFLFHSLVAMGKNENL